MSAEPMRFSAERMRDCDCNTRSSIVTDHDDSCVLFACWACGARTLAGAEHLVDCAERCPHCGSEGKDNDHREGCPTLGTCAQTNPEIPIDEWHTEPEEGDWRTWFTAHMAEAHPTIKIRY